MMFKYKHADPMQFTHQGQGLFPNRDFIISIANTAEVTLLDMMNIHFHYVGLLFM